MPQVSLPVSRAGGERYSVEQLSDNEYRITDSVIGRIYNWPAESLPLDVYAFMTNWLQDKLEEVPTTGPLVPETNQPTPTTPAAQGNAAAEAAAGYRGYPSYQDYAMSSPERYQREAGRFGKNVFDWNFATYDPSGWNQGWEINPGPSNMWFAQRAGYGKNDQQRIQMQLPPIGRGGNVDPFDRSYNAYYGIVPPPVPVAPQAPPTNGGILGEAFWEKVGVNRDNVFGGGY